MPRNEAREIFHLSFDISHLSFRPTEIASGPNGFQAVVIQMKNEKCQMINGKFLLPVLPQATILIGESPRELASSVEANTDFPYPVAI